ncbi:MAG: stage 0 sporulation family protein [Saprospiraceae bacterium]
MGCAGCSTSKSGGSCGDGCQSNGGCGTGGCNRLNTYDWLAKREIVDVDPFDLVEVSFKNGSRKAFFKNPAYIGAITGDNVVVETGNGYDVGMISLSGELVRLQMKKKRVKMNSVTHKILRIANERDMEKLSEARELENSTRVRARVIARTLGLDMKIGDVEYQGDKRKATFFYTADGRVDFRELIRQFAKEFRIKIEMRQIGARQESARIGGIGSCGRELCCSTWLTDFKSVSTAAARYQNLAINQAKLSGQCGRLKCCLNFELDTYLDALEDFPKHVDKLRTKTGLAVLIKTDIFKRIMYYSHDIRGTRKIYQLSVERVKEIQRMNKRGEFPDTLMDLEAMAAAAAASDELPEVDYDSDLTGVVELPPEERKKRRRGGRNRNRRNNREKETSGTAKATKSPDKKPSKNGENKGEGGNNRNRNNRRRGGRNRNNNNRNTKKD